MSSDILSKDLDRNFLINYKPKNKIRFITSTSLFDGHDASINIMRRLIQLRGGEVIHLGHNRTAKEIADAAIQEDVQAVAISSYQGGHMEYFRYVRELIDAQGGQDIKIFGGGGGVITIDEIQKLQNDHIAKIYSPEDGQNLGLEGMIGHMLYTSDFSYTNLDHKQENTFSHLARTLSLLENNNLNIKDILSKENKKQTPVLGITGTGGAGKSSLLDEILLRFLADFPTIKIGVICIDPSKKKTGGALLGDRIRVNSCANDRLFLRSIASRGSGSEVAKITASATEYLKSQDFDFIVVETSGIGQGNTGILDVSDISLYVMTPEYGASTQLEKIDMLDYADFIAVNKYERRQGPDALRDIENTVRRSRFQGRYGNEDSYPVFGTIASRYNDDGTNGLYKALYSKMKDLNISFSGNLSQERSYSRISTSREALISTDREHYLTDISKTVRQYHKKSNEQVSYVKRAESIDQTIQEFPNDGEIFDALKKMSKTIWKKCNPKIIEYLSEWKQLSHEYKSGEFSYTVRGKKITLDSIFHSLAGSKISRIALPDFETKSELTKFLLKENLPGSFPYAGGIFPLRRRGEDPKRQFAGEGGPARTNSRFHYLCKNENAKRLSTAFDSVTLYGSDPHQRPDIYGKVGESGVSIAHLDDMKLLFKEFDLIDPSTSVSMTINGPAPIILAMFLNTAIDQQVDKFIQEQKHQPSNDEYNKIKANTLSVVRGTVQADILKEDQAQNTCIFSTEFALKLMGDIQEFFIDNSVRNYYGVSISGYHIAEAGANPITQLAFTLANGFTFVEYYLKRGFHIDDFAGNLSFFFSNGLDAEYAVLGRVARRIWSIAMRDMYGANDKSQKLKYHIQTSGRSLHAQEMDFNDIRTTLQGLLALYDNCNSLHTNAYDEALTTPTEESVRRAMAIQLIINNEFGPNKCENINQGSFLINELTDLVEESVLQEFERISLRGGVLGAMESQYQRSKIQEESMLYEQQKHSGELPIIGVNTYLKPSDDKNESTRDEVELIRASYDEKTEQLNRLKNFKQENKSLNKKAKENLIKTSLENGNIFAELMNTVRYCSLGEITECLYSVGGKYRRSM